MADFEDTFTGTLDTNLTDHTPDVGTAWTGGGSTTDNARLNGNGEIKAESNESRHTIFADDLGSPDHQVWFELYTGSSALNSRVCCRVGDASNNSYAIGCAPDLANIEITERDSGSTNVLVSHEHNMTDPFWVKLKCEGDTVSAFISQSLPADPEDDTDWTLINSWTNTLNSTVQKPGLFLFGTSIQSTNQDPYIGSFYASSLTSDTTAPTLTNETASADGSDGYSGSVDTNEGNGTLYHVVTQSATTPSATQVKNGNDDTGSAADASDSQSVSSTGTQNVGQTGVLSASTSYYIHYMHEDNAGNQSAVVSSTSFTTDSPDTTAPTLTNPTGTATGSTTADGSVDTDEGNGTLYWVADQSSTDPSVAQIQSGQGSDGSAADDSGNQSVSATGTQNVSASGLAADTTYYFYFQHQDDAGNDSGVVGSSSFTTNAASSDLSFLARFDTDNLDRALSSITDAGTTTPDVSVTPRGQANFRMFIFGLENADNKQPSFTVDFTELRGSVGDSWRPWYTYDDPKSLNATWIKWDNDPTDNGDDTYTFQLSTQFTQGTVYVAYIPAYPVGRSKSLIDWLESNHPDKIHHIRSSMDDPNRVHATMTDQTDEDGNTVPGQPFYSYGIWDSTSYPSDGLPKRPVILAGGQHAGEHINDFALEAAIQWLVGGSAQANALLAQYQFYVYPCLNPCGRWGGHTRADWDANAGGKDPNRDWVDQSLQCTQFAVAALADDLSGRTVVFMLSFHGSWPGSQTEPMREVFYNESADSAFVSAYETEFNAYGTVPFNVLDVNGSMGDHVIPTYNTGHAYTPEFNRDYGPATSVDDWAVKGEHLLRAIDDLLASNPSQLDFAGNYIAETLNGSATISRQLDAAVYPWPPKPADTPVKVERGLGADSSRAFRMDMGGTTGEVFVVLSSVDYENANSDAAAGANIVTVSSI